MTKLGSDRSRFAVRRICSAMVFAGAVAVSLPALAADSHKTIVAGGGHTCGLTTVGGVKCWGSNNKGQLGIGASGDRHTAVAIPGLTGVLSISAGGSHTCIVNKNHGVMCWGDNSSGQLGDNDAEVKSFVPVAVSGLASGVATVSAGGSHSCALTQTGAMLCWGSNASGQLGNGDSSLAHQPEPVNVSGLSSGVAAIGAGQAHSCAVTAGKTVKCWGWNGSGQLGIGSTGGQYIVPQHVKLVTAAASIAVGGDHTCVLTDSATIKCWGENVVGELGDGNSSETTMPVSVHGLRGAAIATWGGGSHSCALIEDGHVRCWGNNVYGQIGDNTNNNAYAATNVKALLGATVVSAGGNHSCALLGTGHAKCWGQNEFGELGNNSTNNSKVPVTVVGF